MGHFSSASVVFTCVPKKKVIHDLQRSDAIWFIPDAYSMTMPMYRSVSITSKRAMMLGCRIVYRKEEKRVKNNNTLGQ